MTLTMEEFYKQIFACPNCCTTGGTAAREQVTLHRTEPSAPLLKPQHTFTRRFHGSYGCSESPQGKLYRKGENGNPDFYITLRGHTHIVEFNALIDFAGVPGAIIIDDCVAGHQGPSSPMMIAFFPIARHMLQTELVPDARVAPYLNGLRVHIASLLTHTTYAWEDDYSIKSGYVSPCNPAAERTYQVAANGLVHLLRDLAAGLAFDCAPNEKGVTI
jgi:hypothetical protein